MYQFDIELMSKKAILQHNNIPHKYKTEEINAKYDELMSKGKQRRCEVCPRTYEWKDSLPPEDIYNMALNVEQVARKLVCSWMCYFKLVGRFVRKAPDKIVRRCLVEYAYHCSSLDNPYFRMALGNYTQTKEDQEHYQ